MFGFISKFFKKEEPIPFFILDSDGEKIDFKGKPYIIAQVTTVGERYAKVHGLNNKVTQNEKD